MKDIPAQILAYPFQKGELPPPHAGQDILLWEVAYEDAFFKGEVAFEGAFHISHSFKPAAQIFENQGMPLSPICAQGDIAAYDYILMSLPKQKNAAQYMLAQATRLLREGGILMASAMNDAGGKRLERWMAEMGGAVRSLSKHKARVAWVKNTPEQNFNQDVIENYLADGAVQDLEMGGLTYRTRPGIFGWNKIDKGSALLIQAVAAEKFKGVGADFGCGYGYLSREILQNSPTVKALYAIDADNHALECARANLKEFTNVEYQWQDLTQKAHGLPPLDWIVMNPPFHEGAHQGTGQDVSIGQKFIENAAHHLKKNGFLAFVANAHLPYEKILNAYFSRVEKITEEQGFKIYYAYK